MNRRTALVAIAALFLVIPSCQKADKRISQANFDQIKVGMTRTDVEAMLGDKCDENPSLELAEGSGAGAAVGIADPSSLGSSTPALKWVQWGPDKKCILICFDRANKVHEKKSKGLQ